MRVERFLPVRRLIGLAAAALLVLVGSARMMPAWSDEADPVYFPTLSISGGYVLDGQSVAFRFAGGDPTEEYRIIECDYNAYDCVVASDPFTVASDGTYSGVATARRSAMPNFPMTYPGAVPFNCAAPGADCAFGYAQRSDQFTDGLARLTFVNLSQTLTITSPSTAQVGAAGVSVSASSSAGLSVTLSIAPASSTVCSLADGSLSLLSAGTCTVEATQSGNATYATASASKAISVSSGAPDPEPSGTADPEPSGTADPEPSGTADPEPSGTADPEPSGTADPEPSGTADPEPSGTADPEPSGTADPEPSDTADPEPSGTTDPEPSGTADPAPSGSGDPTHTTAPVPSIAAGPFPLPTPTPTPSPELTHSPTPAPTVSASATPRPSVPPVVGPTLTQTNAGGHVTLVVGSKPEHAGRVAYCFVVSGRTGLIRGLGTSAIDMAGNAFLEFDARHGQRLQVYCKVTGNPVLAKPYTSRVSFQVG